MKIRVDFHTHTDNSPDGLCSVEVLARTARDRGLDAVAVCDHNRIYRGPAERYGVLILSGCELSTDRGHILGIFFGSADGIKIPDKRIFKFGEAVDLIKSRGGIAVLAHPYQNRDELTADVSAVNFIEIFNARAGREANAAAQRLAAERGLAGICVSDSHTKGEIGSSYTVLEAGGMGSDEIKEALLRGRAEFVCRAAKRRHKGISQLVKTLREKKYARLPKQAAYLCYCALRDLFKIN